MNKRLLMSEKHIFESLFAPGFRWYVEYVCIVVFVSVSVDFSIFEKECTLVECIFIGQVPSLNNLFWCSVENKWWLGWCTVFFAAKDEDFSCRDGARAEPVLNVVFKTWWIHLNQLPEGITTLKASCCVKALDICNLGLIATHNIDEALIKSDCGRKITISIQFRLLSPFICFNWKYLTSLRCIV